MVANQMGTMVRLTPIAHPEQSSFQRCSSITRHAAISASEAMVDPIAAKTTAIVSSVPRKLPEFATAPQRGTVDAWANMPKMATRAVLPIIP